MRPLKKAGTSSSSTTAASGGAGGKGRPSQSSFIIKQAPQDKAIELIKAGNNEALLQQLTEAGEDNAFINTYHTKSGKHPLAVAAEEGRQMESELLIRAPNIDIDKRDTHGMTAALYAAKGGELDILKMLVAAGASVHATHVATQENLLFLAAKFRRVDVVQYLIDTHELPVEITNARGETPLWNALKMEYFDLANVLIAHGANINVRRPGGDTILLTGAFHGQERIASYVLANKGDVLAQNDSGESALMIASRHNHASFVQLLFTHREDTYRIAKERQEAHDYDPEEEKDWGRHPERLKLLENMANYVDNSGKTALHSAVIGLKEDAIKTLLANGADLSIPDKWGYTPLMFAARYKLFAGNLSTTMEMTNNPMILNRYAAGKVKAVTNVLLRIVEYLLEEAETRNLLERVLLDTDNCFQTPLMHATLAGNLIIAEKLLEAGADDTIKNIDEQTAIDLLPVGRYIAPGEVFIDDDPIPPPDSAVVETSAKPFSKVGTDHGLSHAEGEEEDHDNDSHDKLKAEDEDQVATTNRTKTDKELRKEEKRKRKEAERAQRAREAEIQSRFQALPTFREVFVSMMSRVMMLRERDRDPNAVDDQHQRSSVLREKPGWMKRLNRELYSN